MNETVNEISSPYRDPRFLKIHAEVLLRDGNRCVSCRQTGDYLQVRHATYEERDAWDYPIDHYHVICKECAKERTDMIFKLINVVRLAFKSRTNGELEKFTVKLKQQLKEK